MSETQQTYQPGWGETKDTHRHHHHHSDSRHSNKRRLIQDKQAYLGFLLIVVLVVVFGVYKLAKWAKSELDTMPFDDPNTEINVDALRIHKAEEQDALLLADSLSQAYNLDSIKRQVQIDTRAPYRPPKKENKWYITQREWKAIWRDYKIWRWERKREKEKEQSKKQE